MKIRCYHPEDKIKSLISRSVEDIDPEHYSSEQQRHLEEVIPEMNLEFTEKDRYKYFVAVEDEEIVGVAGYQSESGTIAGIFVDPEFKGSGIGSSIMDRIEEDARSEGLEEMETLASLEAVGFYKKNGYEITEEKKHDIEGKRNRNQSNEETTVESQLIVKYFCLCVYLTRFPGFCCRL